MNSNRYSELLEKYYNGETSAEEERLLKEHARLAEQPLPLHELQQENPVMNWSFETMLQQAEATPATTAKKIISFHWMKYAAAVLLIAFTGIALYNYRKSQPGTVPASAIVKEENIPAIKTEKDTISHGIKPTQVEAAIAAAPPVKTKTKSVPAKVPAPAQKNDDFFVVVNGRRITDENEALAILQQSLTAVSGDVKKTMAGINQSPKLDVKFK